MTELLGSICQKMGVPLGRLLQSGSRERKCRLLVVIFSSSSKRRSCLSFGVGGKTRKLSCALLDDHFQVS